MEIDVCADSDIDVMEVLRKRIERLTWSSYAMEAG
jgi:hypothetical protein